MVVDFNNKENYDEVYAKEGITNAVILNQKKAYFGITFKNFPNLDISGATFENCSFENCKVIKFSACTLIRCSFDTISKITSSVTYYFGCKFSNCVSDGRFLYIKRRGELRDCVFENVTAKNYGYDAGYVVDIQYAKKSYRHDLTNCSFANCLVENDKGDFFAIGCVLPIMTSEQRAKMEWLEKNGYNTDDFITDWGETVGLDDVQLSETINK